MGTNQKFDIVAAPLFGRARMAVLALLYSNPSEAFFTRDIIRRLQIAPSNAQRELKLLLQSGLISATNSGRHVYYQANKKCPIYNEILGIIAKTAGVASVIHAALSPRATEIYCAFIFGSFARGDQISTSDVDLFVIGNIGFGDLVECLYKVQDKLGREVSPTVYSKDEVLNKLRDGNPFVTEVMAGSKIFVIGDADELAAMA
jgi:predicted nucleotidyltransferase